MRVCYTDENGSFQPHKVLCHKCCIRNLVVRCLMLCNERYVHKIYTVENLAFVSGGSILLFCAVAVKIKLSYEEINSYENN